MALTQQQYINFRKQELSPEEIIEFEKSGKIPQNKTFGRKVLDFFTRSEQAFGQTLGEAGATLSKDVRSAQQIPIQEAENQRLLINAIIKGRKENKDTLRLERRFELNNKNKTNIEDIIGSIDKSAKQIFGEGLGVATDIAAFGTFGKAAKGATSFSRFKGVPSLVGAGAKKSASVLGSAFQGAKVAGKAGSAIGTAQGISQGMQRDEDLAGIAKSGAIGGVVGGVGGAVVGGAVGGVSGKISQISALKELARTSKDASAKLVRLTNKGTKDKVAINAIKQGLDEADVAAIKTAASGDKSKMRQMADLAARAKDNRRIIERPMDIAGGTVTAPIKSLHKKILPLYSKLDKVAQSLKGKTVNRLGSLFNSIDDDILNTGATIEKSRINFKGSDFEGVGAVGNIMNNVYRRLRGSKTAYDLHRLKKYIDNNVDYGKSSQGLTGQAERTLKGWRRMIDQKLDTQFENYNKVNTDVSTILKELENFYGVFGKKFNVLKDFSEIKAGQVASRILSKSPNRGDILQVIQSATNQAKKFGYKSDEDIINQVIFADILEKLYGTQATQGFQGQISRAIGGELMQSVKSGKVGVGELGVKLGAEALEKVRGITPERQIEALLKLIQ